MAFRVTNLIAWLDSDNATQDIRSSQKGAPTSEVDRWFPFIFLHAGCLLMLVAGVSSVAVFVCASLYVIRMFAITGFYHRYFSHRSFKTSRFWQFIFALVGASAVQRGPLWWAAHHRHHHNESDREQDVHSPVRRSFVWSHIGWITSSQNMPTDYSRVRDFESFPELRLINRFDWFVPLVLFFSMWFLGEYLRAHYPALHTSGLQMVAWGFFVSTTILFHATSSINSLSHLFGTQRYQTGDSSRNNLWLAIITFGEGWHNNHHHFSASARQGFYWWEVDLTYYGLLALKALGVISDLKPVPNSVRASVTPPQERSLSVAERQSR